MVFLPRKAKLTVVNLTLGWRQINRLVTTVRRVLFFFLVFSSSFFHLFMIVAAKGVCSPEGTNDMWLPTSSHGQFDGSPSFVSNNIKASSELKIFFYPLGNYYSLLIWCRNETICCWFLLHCIQNSSKQKRSTSLRRKIP